MKSLVILGAVWILAAHDGSAQCEPERVVSPTIWDLANFGRAVTVEGDVAVIADPSDDSFCPGTLCSSGAIHVFRRSGESWGLEATLYHSRISESDGIGSDVALDCPDRFAASAPGEAVVDGGAIYIFEHSGGMWRETVEILPVEPTFSSAFGNTLALQGDTLVASQRNYACWVYRERNGRWEFDQKIEAPPSSSFTWFSDAIALDGEWLAVGAPHDSTLALRVGLVHLYRRDGGGQFELVQTLAPPQPARSQQGFGTAVAIEQNVLVVGAPFLDSRVGAAFTYELVDGLWTLQQELRGAPVGSDFGAAAALDGDLVIVGAPGELVPGVSFGAAYAFQRRTDGTWRPAATLLPNPSGAEFGWSVATDGLSVVVGAPASSVGGRESPGAAHIFNLPCLLCRADLDGDGELTFFDFLAFQALFAAGDPAADFDGDTALTFFDFLTFQSEFAAGCA